MRSTNSSLHFKAAAVCGEYQPNALAGGKRENSGFWMILVTCWSWIPPFGAPRNSGGSENWGPDCTETGGAHQKITDVNRVVDGLRTIQGINSVRSPHMCWTLQFQSQPTRLCCKRFSTLTYVYTYTYTYTSTCTCTYTYTYIDRQTDRQTDR